MEEATAAGERRGTMKWDGVVLLAYFAFAIAVAIYAVMSAST
jgi:hypothetical protein